jgi:hypothetical protein
MDWIKKNPHLVVALVAAIGLLAASGLLVWGAQGFGAKFEPVQTPVIPTENVKSLDLSELEQTQTELSKPATWEPAKDAGRMLVPEKYTLQDGKLIPATSGFRIDPYSGKPIPNSWFEKYNLPYTDPTVVSQDPDHDGFTNADEWRGEDINDHPGEVGQTDPKSDKSHPPYYTKLFFEQFIRVPFRLKFNAYDGDPKKPEEMTFQINTLDLRRPSEFLKIGDMVSGTHFKISKFEEKHKMNERIGSEEEVSELTLLDTESDTPVVLVLNKVIDSPDSYALFRYIWPKPAIAIKVKKLQQFVLKPETTADKDHLYKVLDVSETNATIKLPSGETKIIGRYMGKTPP